MRMSTRTLVAALLFASAAAPAAAQQATRAASKAAPTATVSAPAPVVVAEVFAVATGKEKWTLGDPVPGQTVLFSGRPMTLEERQINVSDSGSGERQFVYPINWYGPYSSADSDLRLVVVRYDATGARTIIADYMPERVAMPKADFTFDPAGKQYYRNLSFHSQDGLMYVKQAISSGKADAAGNLWVDRLVVYSVDQPPAQSAPAAKRN
jgi:hypothetical protein